MNRNDKYIHFSQIRIGSSGQKDKRVNIFTHIFYYLQNDIKDADIRNKVKALLFLHTLELSYPPVDKWDNIIIDSFFNHNRSNGHDYTLSGIENVPYGYLLLLGGLYWRSRFDKDPIIYEHKNVCSFQKPSNKKDPLFGVIPSSTAGSFQRKYPVFIVSETTNYYGLDFGRFVNICGIPKGVHATAQDKLIKMFEIFVQDEWMKIRNYCELFYHDTKTNKKMLMGVVQFNYLKSKLATPGYSNNLNKTLDLLNGDENTELSVGGEKINKILGFKDNYVIGFIKDGQFYSYYSETNLIQETFRELFFKEVLVTTISNSYNKASDLAFGLGSDSSYYYDYFEGYGEVIENYIKSEGDDVQNFENDRLGVDSIDIVDDDEGYDFRCELYMAFKNIWDRWLCGYYNMGTTKVNNRNTNGKDFFLVNNFFDNNFVFIDTFYNNIHDTLKLNCSELLKLYTGSGNNGKKIGMTTVAHLGTVASTHMCQMFNFPDSVNFVDVDDNGKPKEIDMIENMKQVFTPMSVNKIGEPKFSNIFTIIYSVFANKLNTNDRNNFVSDTFDIWSYEDGTKVAPAVFKLNKESSDMSLLTGGAVMSYKVPAFGVAYSRQNNSIWKNVKVGMENFAMTEQAIIAMSRVVSKGNSEPHNITFYGQDAYDTYQKYSYTVTVEMMGDLQIQPLMYFQLMNIPMFRGTYMIYKVEHHISVGNITTVFTGMKMSKVQIPYTKWWFKISNDDSFVDKNMDESDDDLEKIPTSNGEIDLADNNLSKSINDLINQDLYCDEFVIKVYNELNIKIKNKL